MIAATIRPFQSNASAVRLNIVCFALHATDAARRDRFLEALREDGRVLLTSTFFAGRPAIRAAFANWSTSERDMPLILDALERCAVGLDVGHNL